MTDKKNIQLGNKVIGREAPAFIIAEAGVNHNGSFELATKLIDIAADAGVDAIKFQTFNADKLVTRSAKLAPYQRKNIREAESQFDLLKKLELEYAEFEKLQKYAENKQLIFLSTPFDDESLDFLDSIGLIAYKVSSGDLTNTPFLNRIALKRKPVIISTGMSVMKEIELATEAIYSTGNQEIMILHCTSQYPCPFGDVNLRAMQTISERFPYHSGYSDHTVGTLVPCMAVAMGARIIEKHFTLDKQLPGPDHAASLSPEELKRMVNDIRKVEDSLGTTEKKPTNSEINTARLVRKSLVASRHIHAGKEIHAEDLSIKRPGTGIPPYQIKEVIGKKAKLGYEPNQLINWETLE